MAHDLLIALHATAGLVGFAAGSFSLGLTAARSWRFQVYAGSLLTMVVALVAAVGLAWSTLDPASRWVFTALIVLAVYMLWRAGLAARRLRRQPAAWRSRYLDDIGFTLISLFEGFVIVSAIDLGAAVWLVVPIAVLGLAVGILIMNRVKARLAPEARLLS